MNNEFPVVDPSTWPICFVVSPIGNPGTPGRYRADLFLKFIVDPVLKELGYRALRADKIAAGGLVTSQIVRHLVEAPLVIADLTDHNPNVMYELAIRHAAQKPFVQLIDKSQTIPFDVGQQRTIFFDITDLQSVDDCKTSLKRHIEDALKDDSEPIETPVGRLLDIGKLSAGSKDDAIFQLAAKLDSLTAAVSRQAHLRPIKWGDRAHHFDSQIRPGENWIASYTSRGPFADPAVIGEELSDLLDGKTPKTNHMGLDSKQSAIDFIMKLQKDDPKRAEAYVAMVQQYRSTLSESKPEKS